jgi:hypothetical protein
LSLESGKYFIAGGVLSVVISALAVKGTYSPGKKSRYRIIPKYTDGTDGGEVC